MRPSGRKMSTIERKGDRIGERAMRQRIFQVRIIGSRVTRYTLWPMFLWNQFSISFYMGEKCINQFTNQFRDFSVTRFRIICNENAFSFSERGSWKSGIRNPPLQIQPKISRSISRMTEARSRLEENKDH